MFPNECATLYKKTGVSNKKIQRKTAVQTKQPPQKKKDSEDYSLIFRKKKGLKHKPKIHET